MIIKFDWGGEVVILWCVNVVKCLKVRLIIVIYEGEGVKRVFLIFILIFLRFKDKILLLVD